MPRIRKQHYPSKLINYSYSKKIIRRSMEKFSLLPKLANVHSTSHWSLPRCHQFFTQMTVERKKEKRTSLLFFLLSSGWKINCRSKKGIKECLGGLKCSQNTKKNKTTLKVSFKAIFKSLGFVCSPSCFSLPAACRLFSRGVIFTRARVSLALLSLRKNGGLLVV